MPYTLRMISLMLKRLTNIQPAERDAALVLGVYYFLMTGAYVMAISATSSLFLDQFEGDQGEVYYPLLMALNAIVTTALVTLFSRLVKRLPLIALAVATNLFFGVGFILLEVVLRFVDATWAPPVATGGMNVLALGQYTVASFQYYLIASTMFDARQQKRVLGVIGIGGSIATILGGLALPAFIDLVQRRYPGFGAEAVVLLAAGIMLLMVFVIQRARPHMRFASDGQQTPTTPNDKPQEQRPGALQLLKDPYILTLMTIIGSVILVASTIDYVFQVEGDAHFGNADDFTAYKGTYTAITGGTQMFIRLFLISPLLVNFGLIAGLLMLPATVVIATVAYLVNPNQNWNVWFASFMKGGDQATRFTINETATELSWVPIQPEDRVVVKPFVSGTFIAVMQGITGVAIFGIRQLENIEPLTILAFVILGICVVWIPTAVYLQRGYLRKLMESIREREIDFEDLNIDTADSVMVKTVEQSLRTGTDAERAFMLDMIGGVSVAPWANVLTDVYHETESSTVKGRILRFSAQYPQILSDEELRQLIETVSDLTDEAMIAAGERGMKGIVPLLVQRLQEPNHEMRAAAARALIQLGDDHTDTAINSLRNLLQMNNDAPNRFALDAVNRLPVDVARRIAPPELLRDLVRRPPTLRYRVVQAIAHTQALLLPELITLLAQGGSEPYVREALKQYPQEMVRKELATYYQDTEVPVAIRAAISRTFNDYLTEDILMMMVDSLTSQERAIYNEAVDTILVYARQYPLPDPVLDRLEGEGLKLARAMYSLSIALDFLKGYNEPVLAEAFELDIDEMTPTLLKLSVMDVPHTDVESIIYRLQHQDPQIVGNVLEILENVLSSVERAAIIPLFEEHTIDELAAIGRNNFPDLDESLEDELIFYINNGDDWQCAVALDYIMRHPEMNIHLGNNARNISRESRQLIAQRGNAGKAETLGSRPERQESSMLSILEKTVLLKSASLFEEISARDLYHIAQITEDLSLEAGSVLFEQGDPGSTMYIIVKGDVRIHNDEMTITTLRTGDAIGEIALLDQKPRTATATAVTDMQLLAIHVEPFFNTVTAHVDINRAIMRMLAGRVRHLLATEQERMRNATNNAQQESSQ